MRFLLIGLLVFVALAHADDSDLAKKLAEDLKKAEEKIKNFLEHSGPKLHELEVKGLKVLLERGKMLVNKLKDWEAHAHTEVGKAILHFVEQEAEVLLKKVNHEIDRLSKQHTLKKRDAGDDLAKKLEEQIHEAEKKIKEFLEKAGPKLHELEVKGLQALLEKGKTLIAKLKDWEAHAHTEVGKAILHFVEQEAEVLLKKVNDELDRLTKQHTLRKRDAGDDLAKKLEEQIKEAEKKIHDFLEKAGPKLHELEVKGLQALLAKGKTLIAKLKDWEAHAHTEVGKAILHFVEQEAEVLLKKVNDELDRLTKQHTLKKRDAGEDLAKKLEEQIHEAEKKIKEFLEKAGPKLHELEVKGLQALLEKGKTLIAKLKDWEAHAHTEVGKAILHFVEQEAEVLLKKVNDELDRLTKQHTLKKRDAGEDLAKKLEEQIHEAEKKIKEFLEKAGPKLHELEVKGLQALLAKGKTLIAKLKDWEAHAHTEVGKAILHFVEQEAEVLLKKVNDELDRLTKQHTLKKRDAGEDLAKKLEEQIKEAEKKIHDFLEKAGPKLHELEVKGLQALLAKGKTLIAKLKDWEAHAHTEVGKAILHFVEQEAEVLLKKVNDELDRLTKQHTLKKRDAGDDLAKKLAEQIENAEKKIKDFIEHSGDKLHALEIKGLQVLLARGKTLVAKLKEWESHAHTEVGKAILKFVEEEAEVLLKKVNEEIEKLSKMHTLRKRDAGDDLAKKLAEEIKKAEEKIKDFLAHAGSKLHDLEVVGLKELLERGKLLLSKLKEWEKSANTEVGKAILHFVEQEAELLIKKANEEIDRLTKTHTLKKRDAGEDLAKKLEEQIKEAEKKIHDFLEKAGPKLHELEVKGLQALLAKGKTLIAKLKDWEAHAHTEVGKAILHFVEQEAEVLLKKVNDELDRLTKQHTLKKRDAGEDLAKKLEEQIHEAEKKIKEFLEKAGPKLHELEVKGLQALLEKGKTLIAKLKDWEAHAHTEVGKAILHFVEQEAEVLLKKVNDELDRLTKQHTLRKRDTSDELAKKLAIDIANAEKKIHELLHSAGSKLHETELHMLQNLLNRAKVLDAKLKEWESHAHTEVGKAILHFVEAEAQKLIKKIDDEVKRLSH